MVTSSFEVTDEKHHNHLVTSDKCRFTRYLISVSITQGLRAKEQEILSMMQSGQGNKAIRMVQNMMQNKL